MLVPRFPKSVHLKKVESSKVMSFIMRVALPFFTNLLAYAGGGLLGSIISVPFSSSTLRVSVIPAVLLRTS